jgi:hypothetical protein
VVRSQGEQPGAVFYVFRHPTPYAHGEENLEDRSGEKGNWGWRIHGAVWGFSKGAEKWFILNPNRQKMNSDEGK